uniref:Uncharacterized protein n=1 Tax=Glossina austeni TaxID=7395 RepID=A0A1A9VYW2_GLOAU
MYINEYARMKFGKGSSVTSRQKWFEMQFLANNCNLLFVLWSFTSVYAKFMIGSGMLEAPCTRFTTVTTIHTTYNIFNCQQYSFKAFITSITIILKHARLLQVKPSQVNQKDKWERKRQKYVNNNRKKKQKQHYLTWIELCVFRIPFVEVDMTTNGNEYCTLLSFDFYFLFYHKNTTDCSRRVNALERHRYQKYKSKQIVFGLNGFYATLNRQQVFGIPVASHKVYSSKWSIHANVLRDAATT